MIGAIRFPLHLNEFCKKRIYVVILRFHVKIFRKFLCIYSTSRSGVFYTGSIPFLKIMVMMITAICRILTPFSVTHAAPKCGTQPLMMATDR